MIFWPKLHILTHCGIVMPYGDIDVGSILAQVMACCLTAPSHYLNQCWLISEVLWHSPGNNFYMSAQATILHNEFEIYTFEITTIFPLVPHKCVGELHQHWLRLWPVAHLVPSHYLNRCWAIVNYKLGNKLQWNFNQNTKLSHSRYLIWKYLLINGSYFVQGKMSWWHALYFILKPWCPLSPKKPFNLTHCGLVTSYGDMELG